MMPEPTELAQRIAAGDASATEGAIVALLHSGDRVRARALLVGLGIVPGDVAIEGRPLAAAVKARRPSDMQALVLLRMLVDADSATAADLALGIWRWGGADARRRVAYGLPNMLISAGRTGEVREIFKQIVAAGYLIGDFRPFVRQSDLASMAGRLAARLYARDKERAAARLVAGDSAGAAPPWTEAHDAAVAGVRAETLPGDHVGCDAAVFAGLVAAASPGARYRFEYGDGPKALDRVTDWLSVPAPLTGWWREPLYRHRGEWQPTSVAAEWEESTGDPALAVEAPFARDRNQLNGIGAHDMVLGILWCTSPARGEDYKQRSSCASVGGGELDLRDAVISFTVSGRKLRQNGASLHFWVSHFAIDETGPYTSQWALTGSPFPDAAWADRAAHRVDLVLTNDPRAWTYTGNNPKEQRARAARYRRAPLNTSLAANNSNTVLIFGLGDPLHPPTGALVFSQAEIRFRNYSVLSPAAGAVLLAAPDGGADPRHLTSGWRGYDDHLWTSTRHPSLPLEFSWRLRHPTVLTKVQFNQHPYWPARDVEILLDDESGNTVTAWQGVLPEGRADQPGPDHLLVRFGHPLRAAKVTLRIQSGYSAERCGLDGLELYGEDAVFTPDGDACSVSTEVAGLTPGARVYYRISLDNGGEILAGDVAEIALPLSQAPVIESVIPWARKRDPDCYVVRVNAMGLETELWGELTAEDGAVFTGLGIALGLQPTGRHAYYEPRGIPAKTGKFTICARNTAGETRMPAPWPIAERPPG